MLRTLLLIPVAVLFLVVAASIVLEQGQALLPARSSDGGSSTVSTLISQLPLIGGSSPADVKARQAAIAAALAEGDDAALADLDLDPAGMKALEASCSMMAYGFGLPADACGGAVATVIAMNPDIEPGSVENARRVDAIQSALGNDAELGTLSGGLAGAIAAGGLGASVSAAPGNQAGVASGVRVRPDDGRRNIGARFVRPGEGP